MRVFGWTERIAACRRPLPLGAALALLTACLPVIAHTPVVDPGVHLTVAGTLSDGVVHDPTDSSEHVTVPLPSLALRWSAGFRRHDANGAALELGGQLSLLNGLLVDAYGQAPKPLTGDADVGAGLGYSAVAYEGPVAYPQMGRMVSDELYVFTTQTVSWMRSRIQPDDARRRLWWEPTIALQPLHSRDRFRFYFVTLTFGPTKFHCGSGGFRCLGAAPGALVAIGAAVSPELPGRRRGGLPPR